MNEIVLSGSQFLKIAEEIRRSCAQSEPFTFSCHSVYVSLVDCGNRIEITFFGPVEE